MLLQRNLKKTTPSRAEEPCAQGGIVTCLMSWLPQSNTGKEHPPTSVHPRPNLRDAQNTAESPGQVEPKVTVTAAESGPAPSSPGPSATSPFSPTNHCLSSLPLPLCSAASPEGWGDSQTSGHFSQIHEPPPHHAAPPPPAPRLRVPWRSRET